MKTIEFWLYLLIRSEFASTINAGRLTTSNRSNNCSTSACFTMRSKRNSEVKSWKERLLPNSKIEISVASSGATLDKSSSSGEVELLPNLKEPSVMVGACMVPKNLASEIRVYDQAKPLQEIHKGAYIVALGAIVYKCEAEHRLEGISTNFCVDGKWCVINHPKCIRSSRSAKLTGSDRRTGSGEVELLPNLKKPSVMVGACLVPKNLASEIRVYDEAKPDQEIYKGAYVVASGAIVYKCEAEYRLEGSSYNYCIDGKWFVLNHPKCIRSSRSAKLTGLDKGSGSGEVELLANLTEPSITVGACLVPENLPNEIRVYDEAKPDQEIHKGAYVVTSGVIVYKCEVEYRLQGSSYNYCIDGKWFVLNHPKCIRSSRSAKLTGSDKRSGSGEVELLPKLKEPSAIAGACLVPKNLTNEMRVYYKTKSDQEIPKGTYVGPYVSVIYRCKTEYTLYGGNENVCLSGEWSVLNHPKCIKFCTALTGITTTATCETDGETVSCRQPLRPNTIARITCAVGYRKPEDHFTEILRCDEDGEWDLHATRCEQICGLEAPKAVTYIVGGELANITIVPWHVGIFSDIKDKRSFIQICGGTIVNAKIVVSAAHCFWDSTESKFHDPSHFQVAAGKYYRDFNAIEPLKPQILSVAQINHEQKYNDYAGLYTFDIVVLVLVDYIQFQPHIKPICLETLHYNDKNVAPGSIGRVAGWGFESSGGKSSTQLKIIELPVIEYNECKKKFSTDFRPFITGDKFCAGLTDGQGVCEGDSGGGIMFPKLVGENSVYFFRGIVSVGSTKWSSCDNDKYSLFTNIQYHIDMINFHESRNRPK